MRTERGWRERAEGSRWEPRAGKAMERTGRGECKEGGLPLCTPPGTEDREKVTSFTFALTPGRNSPGRGAAAMVAQDPNHSLCLPFSKLTSPASPTTVIALGGPPVASQAAPPWSGGNCLEQDFLRQILMRTGDSLSRGFPALSQPLTMCKQMASCPLSKASHPLEGRKGILRTGGGADLRLWGTGPRLDTHEINSRNEDWGGGQAEGPHTANYPQWLAPRNFLPFYSFWS